MRWIIVALILSAFGCAPQQEAAKSYGSEASFNIYLEKLNQDLELIGHEKINVDYIKFFEWKTVNLDFKYDGYCSTGKDGTKISIFNPTKDFSWYTYYLVVHELGHCHFHKAHNDKELSIMNTNPFVFRQIKMYSDTERLQFLKEMLAH